MHTNLCACCASKREAIVARVSEYTKGFRCDACRRLTKTATHCAIAAKCIAHDDEEVVREEHLFFSSFV